MAKVIRRAELENKLSVSRSTIYRLERDDESFPKSFHLGRNSKGYLLDEVEAWIMAKHGELSSKGE